MGNKNDKTLLRAILFIAASATFFATPPLRAEPILVGVMDKKPCATNASVRALIMYAKTQAGWISIDTPDAPDVVVSWDHQWTVGFDGRSLETLRLTNSSPAYPRRKEGYYAGEVLLAPTGEFPRVENTSKSFGGWCGEPQYRPLVIVSEPNIKDPEEWKQFKIGVEYKASLFASLSRILKQTGVVNCINPEQEVATAYNFRAEEMKIYTGYKSKNGRLLISVGLNNANYHCDGPPGTAWSDHWFYIQDSSVEFIGDSLSLLDAGDYDADGKAEVLFWSSGYNEDGYVLYYDNFRKSVKFKWHYH